jgi:Lrp/AsnC family transcriptional regulator, leucine-responsive regulatory protein
MTDMPSPMSGLADAIERPRPPVPLDDVDRILLRMLAENSRVSQRKLALAVEMSPPAVADRLARLERLGVIRGYTVDVDWSAAGYPIVVYIPMIVSPGADVQVILSRLRQIPELDELIVVTGAYDLLARFRLRDHPHLRELLLDQLWQIAGLQRIETFLSLGQTREEPATARLLGRRLPAVP